ncbi:MAG: hypothetical protein RIR48_3354 [Bacteroidota bacterium]
MNNLFPKFILVLVLLIPFYITGQERVMGSNMEVTTQHQVTIKGNLIQYTVVTGSQPVWGEDGKEIAYLHYTYYKRNGVKSYDDRPLLISFNGGPGSASVWMHLAYTGPRVLKIDDEGYPVHHMVLKKIRILSLMYVILSMSIQ